MQTASLDRVTTARPWLENRKGEGLSKVGFPKKDQLLLFRLTKYRKNPTKRGAGTHKRLDTTTYCLHADTVTMNRSICTCQSRPLVTPTNTGDLMTNVGLAGKGSQMRESPAQCGRLVSSAFAVMGRNC